MNQIKIIAVAILCLVLVSSPVDGAKMNKDCTGNPSTKLAAVGKTYMPLAVLAIALLKQDYYGAALSQVLTHGYYWIGTKTSDVINKKRPCGCDHSFPSGHMIKYSVAASFLHARYGIWYGIPAYVATFFFARDRYKGKSHSVFDLTATFVLTAVATWAVTGPFKKKGLTFGIHADKNEKIFMLKYRF